MADYGGKLPHDRVSLSSLPGVGNKIAIILIKTCFGRLQEGIPVDVHVKRFSQGMGYVPSDTNDQEVIQAILEGIFPSLFWEDFNEVYGCLGQVFGKKSTHSIVRRVACRTKFSSIRERLLLLLAEYAKRSKTKRSNSEPASPAAKRPRS